MKASFGPRVRSAVIAAPSAKLRPSAPAPAGLSATRAYVGGKEANKHKSKRRTMARAARSNKASVIALVERDGSVRSFHVPNVSATTLRPIIVTQVNRASYITTDDAAVYTQIGREFSGHGTVNHSAEEYVRATFWHTSSVEIISRS